MPATSEMELSPEVLLQLQTVNNQTLKEDVKSTVVKFDDMGTLHLRGYDENGKPIQDLAFKKEYPWTKKRAYDHDLKKVETYSYVETAKSNKINKVLFAILMAVLCTCTLLIFIIINLL